MTLLKKQELKQKSKNSKKKKCSTTFIAYLKRNKMLSIFFNNCAFLTDIDTVKDCLDIFVLDMAFMLTKEEVNAH